MGFMINVKDYMWENCTHTEGTVKYGLICGTCAAIVFSKMENEANQRFMRELERVLDSHDQQLKTAYERGLEEGRVRTQEIKIITEHGSKNLTDAVNILSRIKNEN